MRALRRLAALATCRHFFRKRTLAHSEGVEVEELGFQPVLRVGVEEGDERATSEEETAHEEKQEGDR